METFTQPKITGYRQLSEDEAALMNEGKRLAEECGAFVAKLRELRREDNNGIYVAMHDPRWISIGATDLQTGFMALMRAIAKPTSF